MYICSTYVGHIVAAVLFFRAAAAVLLALLVLEGSVILSELFAVLEHKAVPSTVNARDAIREMHATGNKHARV